MATENVVDDWTEWLDKEDDESNAKREDVMSGIDTTNKNDEIQKQILKNNLDDIADFLDIDDSNKHTKDLNDELEKKPSINVSQKNEKIINLESTPLNTLKDCELMANTLAKRIEFSKAKSVALERFFSILIHASESKIEDKDLNSLLKKIQTIIKNREVNRRHKSLGKKKPNSEMNVIKNYKDEVDMLYGDLSSSFEEEDYEEPDEVLLEYG